MRQGGGSMGEHIPRSCSRRSALAGCEPCGLTICRCADRRPRATPPRDMARFREIDHCACNALRSGDRAHRRQCLEEVLRVVFVKRSVNNARRDRIEADVVLSVLRGQATCDGLEAAFP
jgi:hypothetical protein